MFTLRVPRVVHRLVRSVFAHCLLSASPERKHIGNSFLPHLKCYLFPNCKVLPLGRSAPGVGLCGTVWCKWPQREGLPKCVSFGVEGVEGKGSTGLKSCPSGGDVEKDEVSYPSLGRTCVRSHACLWALLSSHITMALLLFPACVVGRSPEGEWGCLHPEDCLSLCGGHWWVLKLQQPWENYIYLFLPKFCLLFYTRAPQHRDSTSWWKSSASNPGTCLWLCSHTHLWSKTPLMNWSLPVDTEVPSFPATRTKLRCAGVITVSAPSLPYRSCFQREERGLKGLAEHSVVIFDFPPLRHRWGKRKQHETSPFLGLPEPSLHWGKAPCQAPCKQTFGTNLLGPRGT